MNNETLNIVVGTFASIGTVLGAWFLFARLITPLVKRVNGLINAVESFVRDWSGTPAEPGRDRTPGVMERLNDIDGQLKNNGGSSVKDAVDRIEIRVSEIDDRLAEGDRKFDEIHNELKRIQKDLY
jgi:hypothetical protein